MALFMIYCSINDTITNCLKAKHFYYKYTLLVFTKGKLIAILLKWNVIC